MLSIKTWISLGSIIYLLGIITALSCLPLKAEVTVKDLFFDESKPFHLKIIDVIPEEGILQIGNDDAKNTIIEFCIQKITIFKRINFLI